MLLTIAGAFAVSTWSGFRNEVISTNYAGIYLDFDDVNDASSYSTPSEPVDGPVASWDVNFFFSGVGIAYSPTFQPFVDDDPSITNQSQILNVAPGTTIDATSATGQVLGVAGYGGSGQPIGSTLGEDHLSSATLGTSNPDYSAFTVGTPGYLAFVADVEGTTVYGWMKVTFQNDGSTTGLIHEWAWSDTAINVGVIPEPGTAVLIVLGAAAFMRRRRG